MAADLSSDASRLTADAVTEALRGVPYPGASRDLVDGALGWQHLPSGLTAGVE